MGDGLETDGWGEERGRSSEHWFLLFVALLIPVALTLMALFFEPDARGFGTHEQLGIQPCLTLDLWGVPCPGCGVTTSVTLAAQGHPLDSLATQPLGFLLALGGVLFTVWGVSATLRGRDLNVAIMNLPLGRLGRALVTIVLFAWVYKWLVTAAA